MHQPPRRVTRGRIVLFGLALCVLVSCSWIAVAGATQVSVSQCPNPGSAAAASDPSCQQSSFTLTPQARPRPRAKSHPSTKVVVVQAPAAKAKPKGTPGETHVYSLATGKGSLKTAAGKNKASTIQVQLAPGVLPPAKAPAPGKGAGSRPIAPAAPVSTIGGVGFGAQFNLVSADQALSQFEIPPFLVPIYVAAGKTYGIPWNVLAAINRIETDFGRNLSVSTAGAEGWMQFMPAEWKVYGVDATGKGSADPYNPVDAIYAAARYLRDAGGATDLRKAVFAYNHATWYVDEVLKNAGIYGSLPSGLVAETGSLAYGHFPLTGPVTYGNDFAAARAARQAPTGLTILGRGGARAVATQAVTVSQVQLDPNLAQGLQRRGTLASLGDAPATLSPTLPAAVHLLLVGVAKAQHILTGASPAGVLAFASRYDQAQAAAAPRHGQLPSGYVVSRTPGITAVVSDALGNHYSYGGLSTLSGAVRPGAALTGGQTIGALAPSGQTPLVFSVRAAAGGLVDPRPLVDGYRLQESVNFYHAVAPFGANPFVPSNASNNVGHGYVFPIPSDVQWTSSRTDMGWDIEAGSAGVGHPLLAIGDAQILHIQSMGAFGPTWISYKLLSGPAAGRAVFIGHSGAPLVQPGQVVRAGQPIILIHGGSYGGPVGHMEIGWASADGSNTLAAPHYREGDVTPEGVSFKSFLLGVTGSSGGLLFPGVFSGANPAQVTKAQEYKLSAELNRITNPKVAGKPGPGSIPVTGTAAPAAPAASLHGALTLASTAAGARLTDVTVPTDGHAAVAYAIGTVNGAGHPGWAPTQTVLLGLRNGGWVSFGPPIDRRGHATNPSLHAIAAAAGLGGYAVGEHGQVVRFDGRNAPQVLAPSTHAPLDAVAARRRHGRLMGIAVGASGTVVHLDESSAKASPALAGRPMLSAVTYDTDGTALIAGAGSSGSQGLYHDNGASTTPDASRFGLPSQVSVTLSSLARRGSDVWIAGGISETPGSGSLLPFVAHRTAAGWHTYCPRPGGSILELGSPTPSICQDVLGSGSGLSGPATAIAATPGGAIVAGPSGFQGVGSASVIQPTGLPAIAGGGGTPQRIALDNGARGWTIAADGRAAALSPASAAAPAVVAPNAVVALPGPASSAPATVTVAPGGGEALAFSGGQASAFDKGAWHAIAGPRVPVRGAAVSTAGTAWALAETGQLLWLHSGAWSVVSGNGQQLSDLVAVNHVLGGQALTPAASVPSHTGFSALSFSSPTDGLAVGAHGLIAHYSGSAWKQEKAPGSADLTAVTANPDSAVAVGRLGTVLERNSGAWTASAPAGALVAGQDLTAVGSLADGTVLAAGAGTIIERTPKNVWQPSGLPALGLPVLKLAGYRDAAGLHALALVDGVGGYTLLDGEAGGWRPLALPAGFVLSDFTLDLHPVQLWLAGTQGGHAVTAEAGLPSPTDYVAPPGPLDVASTAPHATWLSKLVP